MAQTSIWIIDDEADLKGRIIKDREISGFHVKSELGPADALTNFKAGAYKMAILDVRMPNIDGFDLYDPLSQARISKFAF